MFTDDKNTDGLSINIFVIPNSPPKNGNTVRVYPPVNIPIFLQQQRSQAINVRPPGELTARGVLNNSSGAGGMNPKKYTKTARKTEGRVVYTYNGKEYVKRKSPTTGKFRYAQVKN